MTSDDVMKKVLSDLASTADSLILRIREMQYTLRDAERKLEATRDANSEVLPEDEIRPDFVLKATDRLAPIAVRHWIDLAEGNENVSIAKARRARLHLAAMVEWQEENPGKVKWPD